MKCPFTLLLLLLLCHPLSATLKKRKAHTEVSIAGDMFYINGAPTFKGRIWNGYKIEGLLPNARMVQGIFDDLNPETRSSWVYPDTREWSAGRNTDEFLKAMPEWKRHGLLAFTINLQGGSPQGYSQNQPWHNSALTESGDLRKDYMRRLEKIMDRADELGMVVILGIFYFGQDERLKDEDAVLNAVDRTVDWLFDHNYRNVLIEINNECDIRYNHAILQPDRIHELIDRVKMSNRKGWRYPVSTSYSGGTLPRPNVVRSADFLLLHGNGVEDATQLSAMVEQTRRMEAYRPVPIVFNEDDHFNFDQPISHFVTATAAYASWGFFDYRMQGENFGHGYQSIPVNWAVSSPRKKGFFDKLREITGGF